MKHLRALCLGLLACGGLAYAPTRSLDSLVRQFSSNNKNAGAVLADLARQVQVTIGISGFVVERKEERERLISVDVRDKPLPEVLDEICSKDPDYNWQLFDEHNIHVRLGSRRLSFIQVVVAQLSISKTDKNQTFMALLHTL